MLIRPRPIQQLPLLVALALNAAAQSGETVFDHFVTRVGGGLYDGDKPFRSISWNIPNLHNVEDAFTFLGETPWRWPNEYEIADALETTRQMGGLVARTYVLSVRREGSDTGDHVFVLGPGEFNEQAFQALDRVLAIANEKGVRICLPLVDQWHWWGGIRQYEAFRGKPEGSFWTDQELIADFKRTIEHVVNRRNTVTGQLYKEDKAILCWETGNEISSPAAWTREIAAYIKSLDPIHLVMDGRSLKGVPEWSLSDPNIDIVTTHHYPGGQRSMPDVIREAIDKTAGKRPYLVGEIGFIPTETMREVFDAVIASDAIGVLPWSLRFRNRDGGFYAHSEPAADGRYKAYHWPGFASGDTYDETPLLRLMRSKAYEIRGEPAPTLPAPGAATLLPIDDPGAITWRGPTGAESYDVQRATGARGPWKTLVANLPDADSFYRPLFADESAEAGQEYFYRVISRNSAGEGPPSDVVGPVSFGCRILVDELRGLDKAATYDGDIHSDTGNARAVQEDPHRLSLGPGASLQYKTDGPIVEATVYLFTPDETVPELSIVKEGGGSVPNVILRRDSPKRAAGDYGYLTPVRLLAKPEGGSGSRLLIQAPASSPGPVQLSRVEVRYLSP